MKGLFNKYFFFCFSSIFVGLGDTYTQNISLPVGSEVYVSSYIEENDLFKNPIRSNLVECSKFMELYDIDLAESFINVRPEFNDIFYVGPGDNNFFYTRNGLRLISTFSEKISVDLAYTFNYSSIPRFAKEKVDSTFVFPHYAKTKKYGEDIYYFQNFVGEIVISPTSFLNFTFGNKHSFLGNGHRSLFLSDNSGNFCSAKALINVWNINYLFQTSFLRDIHKTEQPYDLNRKYGTSHFISWDVTPKLNLNFFESVIWAPDDSTINRGYDINYLNPVVFLRPVEFSVGSPDNVLLGLGGNIELSKNILLYSQFILDEFNISFIRETEKWWANKFGYQFGIKYWRVSDRNTFIIYLEHNWMRPFTFTHAYSSKSYGHAIQPLAHPLGANFKEWVASINYSKNRFFIENVFYFQQYGTDSISTNYGNNIYKSNLERSLDYGSTMLQGIKNNVFLNQLTLSYLLYPKWFTFFDFGITYRNQNYEEITDNKLYFSLGIRTGINRKNVFDNKY